MSRVETKSQKEDKYLQEVRKGYNTSPVLQDEEVRQYLKYIQTKFYIVPIDKASNNFSFVCKKFCVFKLLDETGLRGTQSDTYKLVNKLKN